MTIPRVEEALQISLNGNRYRITQPVRTRVIPPYPVGPDVGDVGSRPESSRVRRVRWDNARGGIGIKDHHSDEDVFRIFYGTSHIRVDGHTTLPDRVTTTATSGVTGVIEVDAMAELADVIYVAYSTSIRSYTFATDTWSSNLHTLAALPTDTLTARLGGTVYMIFFYSSGYVYTTDGSVFTSRTEDVQFGAVWDDRLWGIDSTGQLRWAFDPTGTWTDDAQLPQPNDYVQDLAVYDDAAGELIPCVHVKMNFFSGH